MNVVDEKLERRIREAGLDRDDFLAPRRCMREPIPEVFQAAHMLDRAVGAHLAGDHDAARTLIRQADMPSIRTYTEMLWGKEKNNPNQWRYIRKRSPKAISSDPPQASPDKPEPSADTKRTVIGRYGCNCAYCGMPVIRKEIRVAIRKIYPDALGWELGNKTQHAAFQCMWLQYDHVVPHSKGGNTQPANLVVACAPCNFGRLEATLEEVGVVDPRDLPVQRTSWDGLERFLVR